MRVGPALCPWLDHIIDPYKLTHRQLYVFDTYTNFICTLLQIRFVGTAHLFIRGGSKFNSFLQKSGSTAAVHSPPKMHQGGWPHHSGHPPQEKSKIGGGGGRHLFILQDNSHAHPSLSSLSLRFLHSRSGSSSKQRRQELRAARAAVADPRGLGAACGDRWACFFLFFKLVSRGGWPPHPPLQIYF